MEKYEKIRFIGRGAYGAVYLSHRISDKKLVILKEIPVDQMTLEERQASMNEAKVLSMLDHPNIIAYHESFLGDKMMVIVMEYVRGGTLFDFLKQRDGELLTEAAVLHYFGQMVYTLQHVHAKLILHRDLKSQNVLLNESKTVVKIGDFGISKVLSSKSKAYTVVGTPCYISPELCEGKPYNQKSDIWALGCILYELMTLKRPFEASTLPALVMKIMRGCFDPVPDIYSSELQKLLMSMLSLDPHKRPSAAHIMCHPVMMNAIFKLYVDIGSIPSKNRLPSGSSFSNENISDASELKLESDSDLFMSDENSVKKKRNFTTWYLDNKSSSIILLPSPPKGDIKSVSLGSNQKIGLTRSGLLISWKSQSQLLARQKSCSATSKADQLESSAENTYIASIVDEKFAVNISFVACGKDFTVSLSDTGVVYTFGKVSSGCLGLMSRKDILQPRILAALFSYNIKSIACGPRHVLALSDENDVFAWGYNTHGCLGLKKAEFQIYPLLVKISSKSKLEKVFCGVDCSFLITDDKSLLACGNNRHNKLGMDSGEGYQVEEVREFTPIESKPLSECKIVSISAGKSHTLFLCENGEVFSVGSNHYFQLGCGKSGLDYSLPQRVEKLENVNIAQVACSDFYSMAVSEDNYLFCWGKYPSCLEEKKDSEFYDVEVPTFFKEKIVTYVSCNSENCMVVCEDRCSSK